MMPKRSSPQHCTNDEPAALRPLDESAERYVERSHASNPVALFAVSDAGVILSHDSSFANLFSIPVAVAAPGGSVRDLIAWFRKAGDERLATLLESVDGARGELATGGGRIVVWHRARLDPSARSRSQRGSVLCFHEVAKERAAIQGLRDAENWLQMFAAQTGGAIVELDEVGGIVGTWSADGEILTFDERQLHGQQFSELLGGKYAPEFDRLVQGVVVSGDEGSFEYISNTTEERRVFAMTVRARANDEEAASVVSVLIRDVTEQTRMQTQLVQAERLASVGLLAAGVAHEINNPITYMLLNLDRVRRGVEQLGTSPEAAELEQRIEMMVEGAHRIQQIVQDLQRFSRSDRGELREPVDVRTVMDFTLGMVSFEIERHARLVRDFGWVPLVLATDGRLSQVFLNLILNAVQALPTPDPEHHEIRLVTTTDHAGNAVVEVRDTGVGIGPAEMRKIFDPFYTTKPANIGTGLGLSICHGIVQSLGGEITVDSTPGSGTVFRVVLPPAASSGEVDVVT